jgi:hypothetical protein
MFNIPLLALRLTTDGDGGEMVPPAITAQCHYHSMIGRVNRPTVHNAHRQHAPTAAVIYIVGCAAKK